jgi:nucleotide-binding universal stress UspA family protein
VPQDAPLNRRELARPECVAGAGRELFRSDEGKARRQTRPAPYCTLQTRSGVNGIPNASPEVEGPMIVIKNVLVATDFSPPSDAALIYGRALARRFGASLHLLHAVENFFLRPTASDPQAFMASKARMVDALLTDDDRRLGARSGIEVSDSPAEAIADYAKAEGIDLIVIGTHGRTGMSRFLLGSVAEHLLRTAPCPVLTVRHPEHEFIVPEPPEEGTRPGVA